MCRNGFGWRGISWWSDEFAVTHDFGDGFKMDLVGGEVAGEVTSMRYMTRDVGDYLGANSRCKGGDHNKPGRSREEMRKGE